MLDHLSIFWLNSMHTEALHVTETECWVHSFGVLLLFVAIFLSEILGFESMRSDNLEVAT